ncbi:hypothetical protein PG994_007184 [Apiospora phragmitis]|uniref:NFX1-type zinc finger-containing protein 1 n=1 Tax=Apiospora phragmitis TaxID=2905665 RepID=A0ABR1V021_9PEZI
MSSSHQRSWRRSSNSQRGGSLDEANSSRSSKPQSQKPCHFFLRTGTCHYGSGCKYSHERGSTTTTTTAAAAAAAGPRSSQSATNTETEDERNNYRDWKRLLRRQPSSVDKRATLKSFWSQALAIVESSAFDQYQLLVKDLTDDQYAGCLYLIQTLEMRVHVQWDEVRLITRAMLKLITHPKILDCLSIDTPVGTMYSVISGSNGNRAVPFLTSFCVNLESGCRRHDIPMQELTDYVQLVLDTTHELLSREKRVAFCEHLLTLFDQLALVIPFLDTENDRRMKTDRLSILRKIARLSTGRMTASTNGDHARSAGATANVPSVYPRELKLPGTRHDNDHHNIAQISILPTAGELLSDHVDYLPSTDFRQPHFLDEPALRYLDTHFRLLRHDVFGPLKEVLGALIPSVARNDAPHKLHFNANVHLYHNSSISHVSVDDRRGFEIHITFTPPKHLQKKTVKERHQWWSGAKRLEVGSLLYLVFPADDSVMLLALTVSNKPLEGPSEHSLLSAISPVFKAKLAMQGPTDVGNALRMYTEKSKGVLVELPGLIPATFSPVLENLQRMTRMGDFPFQEWIIPKPEESPSRSRSLEPPRYARATGFSFSLDPIATGDGPPLSLSAACSSNDTSLINDLESRLALDRGQCQALVAALTQEFSLIQGPPGTGKSYLGVQLIRVLLGCKRKANLGPIIIVCFTNHALDQFLMHLKQVGITKFIRIGGQSRTSQIDEHNLRNVNVNVTKTRHEGYLLGSTYSSLEDELKKMGVSLATFQKLRKNPLSALGHFLRRNHPKVYSQFFEEDAEGFARVGKDPIGSWLGCAYHAASAPALDEEGSWMLLRQAERNVDSIPSRDRRRLIDVWFSQMKQDRIELLHENIAETESMRSQINAVHNEVNRRTLADADIIGITTTGMAREVSLLLGLRSKVVLCEEAGEVLEAHVVSALLPSVEHFIQIGDHQQLRPTINSWSTLSLESSRGQDYQLDRSQFERLALGQPGLPPIPLSQLNIQRRMRSDIAALLRKTINTWEVGMVQALVRHIVRQGVYKSEDIAVITPYTGNLQKLRASLSSDFEITMSDRDEETMAKEGFSADPIEEDSSPHGMYLVGNVDTYSNIAMWNEVRSQLEAAGRIGPAVELCCPRHPDTAIRCGEPDDFARFSPEGGCSLACDRRHARCGHKCQAKCHSETMHEAFLCPQPCPRRHSPCNHGCDKLCGEDCGKCMVPMRNVLLPCGHFVDDIPCHQAQQPSGVVCHIKVEKKVTGCKHVIKVPCNTDVTAKDFHCPTKCDALLGDCGHSCSGMCGKCRKEENGEVKIMHQPCKKLCKRPRSTCGHICPRRCHAGEACDPCDSRCEVRCAHSRCPLPCQDPCPPCIEKCAWFCVHQGGCSMPCAAPCDRLPCDERCQKQLKCGHQCPGLCGETCLEGHCQACLQKLDSRVDLLEFRTFGEIDLDESPVVTLSCGHFFTAESLDGLVNIAAVYTLDGAGRYNGIKDPSEVLALPSCPDCKQPIRQLATQRYNRIINMAVMDETSKKFQMKGAARLKKLEEATDAIETSLEDSYADIVKGRRPDSRHVAFKQAGPLISYHSRYGRCTELRKEVQAFCKEASHEQQPIKKLSDAIVHSRSSLSKRQTFSSSLDEDMTQLHLQDTEIPTPAAFNQQVTLGARMSQLRIDDVMLRDQLRLVGAKLSGGIVWPSGRNPNLLARLFLRESEAFIDECQTSRLPRLAVQASIAFARIVGYIGNTLNGHSGGDRDQFVTTTRRRLDDAAQMCGASFEGAPELLVAVEGLQRLFEAERYEVVTADELASIKAAMVSGRGGIATHSGHWYKCRNGHIFAIGECGMPMELARCPECRAPIGGQHHQLVEGASRAAEMEQ